MPVAPNRKIAPDGGPVSHAHRTLKGWKKYPVMKVRKRDTGQELLIKSGNFDPKLYEPVEDFKKRVSLQDAKPPEPIKFSQHSQEEMLKMTIDGLRKLPEFMRVENPPTTKPQLVRVLLEVREAGLKKQVEAKK